ncbi:T9SS type A sorting domain-containing protein [Hymenobacter rubripertinctus]|uniref:T9SS C-terminal target domain-containing protein n=1 Tax=Hymenobacter rubripertinctus TaxID=2029981 RepID=A0A418QJK6_9BACT|nr:T9SS C-terminal target domain-containing protein [Hymenobacter rubripertinctus]
MYVAGCSNIYRSGLAYPNPADEKITVPTDAEKIEVINQYGKVILNHPKSVDQLNLTNLPDGLYMLRITRDGKTETQRLQIKH